MGLILGSRHPQTSLTTRSLLGIRGQQHVESFGRGEHSQYNEVMKIKVIVHDAEEGGYWAEVPAIPGCATQGETFEELLRNLYEAVEGCLSVDVSQVPVHRRRSDFSACPWQSSIEDRIASPLHEAGRSYRERSLIAIMYQQMKLKKC